MSKYYGISSSLYAICGLTYQVYKSEIPFDYKEQAEIDHSDRETSNLAKV